MKRLPILTLPIVRFAMVACLSLLALAPARMRGDSDGQSRNMDPSYSLRPMDLVKIQVFQEPDLDRELRVSQDRTIVMPLIGVIDVKKRTIRDVEQLIASLYSKDYLVNPQVNITVMEYSPKTVNVLGAVNTPGSVLIPPGNTLNLLDAIAHSGGFSRLANRSKLSLTRNLPDGQTENFTIDADHIVSGNSANQWTLQDGDVIFVPERIL
jgi:polysaccharide export outer membrane protein